MLKVAVLASGRGSNLVSLLESEKVGSLDAKVVVVVSNHPQARALSVAREHGVESLICPQPWRQEDREAAQTAMSDALQEREVGLVVCAGFDRVLVGSFVRLWEGKIINVHPSLLPAFANTLHAQEEALSHGVKVSGCTVHMVTEDVDGGPIISQAAVPVLPGDDAASLSARILEREHRLLPEAVRLYAGGHLRVEGRTVVVGEG